MACSESRTGAEPAGHNAVVPAPLSTSREEAGGVVDGIGSVIDRLDSVGNLAPRG